MYNRQLERNRQDLINEVKKLDLSEPAQKDIIKALKKMNMAKMLWKQQNGIGYMDFMIFDNLRENCHVAFADMDDEDVTYYLHEIVYNAIPELEEF